MSSDMHHHVYAPERAAGLLNPLRALAHHPKRLFGDALQPGDTVVDLGCGPGFFALRMAKLVQPGGRVIAVDVQPQMLAMLNDQIAAKRLEDVIFPHLQPSPDQIALDVQADTILAFYMLHEVREKQSYLKQIRRMLKPGGSFILVEPNFVVSQETFDLEAALVKAVGFLPVKSFKIFLSRAMRFTVHNC